MNKTTPQAYSYYPQDALTLLGELICAARKERKFTTQELTGISKGLLRCIENGDPKCSIGTVFEIAALVGVPLFNSDKKTLHFHRGISKKSLSCCLSRLEKAQSQLTMIFDLQDKFNQ